MTLKKSLLVAMAFIAMFAFVSCEDSESSSEGYFVKFTIDSVDYSYQKGFADKGKNDPFGNIFGGGATWIAATPDGPALTDSTDYILIGCNGSAAANYYGEDVNILIHIGSTHWESTDSAVTITEYGELNGVISGSFIASFYDGDMSYEDGSGIFKVKRYPDNTFAPL